MKYLCDLLSELENKHIFYELSKIREDSIMIEVAVPGERWEKEVFTDEHIEIERFISTGEIEDASMLNVLFKNFSD